MNETRGMMHGYRIRVKRKLSFHLEWSHVIKDQRDEHFFVCFSVSLNQDGSLQCPTCKTIYGEKTGTQPPGKMEYHVIPHCLPGYPDSKSIRIVYDIPAGIQVRSKLGCKSAVMDGPVSRSSASSFSLAYLLQLDSAGGWGLRHWSNIQ